MNSKILILLIFLPTLTFSCPDGAQASFDGSCYMPFNGPSDWFESEYRCNRLNGYLVTIPNVFDNTFLNGIANEELPSGTVDYWIGGSTAYNQGWQWVDNSNMNYTLWDSKQPINTNGSYCMVQQIRNGKWAQSMCNLTKPYICKVPSNLGPQCPTGWAYSGVTKKCYLLTTQMQSWNDSLTLCQNFNASLVSIHSALENMITSTIAFSYYTNETFSYWIGLYQNNGQWVWADGSNNNYTGWQSGQGFSNYAYGQVGPNSINGWYSNSQSNINALCQKDANVI